MTAPVSDQVAAGTDEPGAGKPEVDVGMVTWNTRDLAVASLRQVLAAGDGCRLGVLVHDNASTDGTAEAVREEVPGADVAVSASNRGFAAGVNALLARSRAPWFLVLNSDAWPEPGAIATMVREAQRWPGAGAVAPRLLRPDGAVEHSTHALPSVRLAAAAALGPAVVGRTRAERWMLEGAWHHDRPRLVGWAVGAALLLRRGAVEDVGGFDERFFMYAEDLEWCWRARRRGWTVRFTPAAVVRHVGNASGAIAFGDSRDAAVVTSSYRFYREQHGALATAGFAACNVAGAARLYTAAWRRRDRGAAGYWSRQLKAHLGLGLGLGGRGDRQRAAGGRLP
jgi:GT2 family glycosyltransferase